MTPTSTQVTNMQDLLATVTPDNHSTLNQLLEILNSAKHIADNDTFPSSIDTSATKDRTAANLFFENSTRTRLSFELAAKRLHMHTLNMDVARSSAAKGETLADTIRTVDAMGVHAIVIRHEKDNAARLAAENASATILNAGTGTTAHPTQALLDVLTIARLIVPSRPIDASLLADLRITILGDINHSRVASSLVPLAAALGAHITLAGPEQFVSKETANRLGAHRVSHELKDAIAPEADPVDIIYTLRIQHERHADPATSAQSTSSDYAASFGLTADVLSSLAPRAYLMHPGPVNRGVELDGSAMALERCLIQQQVAHGVWARIAAIKHCITSNTA